MEVDGYDYVQVLDPEGQYGIIISAKIGFKIEEEIQIINIGDEQGITHTDIYKAFEDLIKFYKNKK